MYESELHDRSKTSSGAQYQGKEGASPGQAVHLVGALYHTPKGCGSIPAQGTYLACEFRDAAKIKRQRNTAQMKEQNTVKFKSKTI